MDIQRFGTTARYSDAVVHNHTLYAVEVPPGASADVPTQTAQLLASVEALLARHGSDKGRILMATIYLVDMADYAAVNAVWDAWLPPGSAPSRACVEVKALADPGWCIEIALTAAC